MVGVGWWSAMSRPSSSSDIRFQTGEAQITLAEVGSPPVDLIAPVVAASTWSAGSGLRLFFESPEWNFCVHGPIEGKEISPSRPFVVTAETADETSYWGTTETRCEVGAPFPVTAEYMITIDCGRLLTGVDEVVSDLGLYLQAVLPQ